MRSVPFFNRTFIFFAIVLLGIVLLIRLGFWQLERAEEKRRMLAKEAAIKTRSPLFFQGEKPLPEQYQPIRLEGKYLSTIFLLDNQHHNHQFGYHVISPFILKDGSIIFVDRGWVKGDPARREFPLEQIQFPLPYGQGSVSLVIHGKTYYPSVNSIVLGPQSEKKSDQLIIVEQIDTKMMANFLQKNTYPFIMRLDKSEQYGYVREWAIVSMSPERHKGYAFQWFALAFILFVTAVALYCKKRK